MNFDRKVEGIAEMVALNFIERSTYEAKFECGSPIEELFYIATKAKEKTFCQRCYPFVKVDVSLADLTVTEVLDALSSHDRLYAYIIPQVRIQQYTVDFLVVKLNRRPENKPLLLAVECDGHEFHEKTKEQAARDKRRDREISANGVEVWRFTGSEIWENALDCIEDVLRKVEDYAKHEAFQDPSFQELNNAVEEESREVQ